MAKVHHLMPKGMFARVKDGNPIYTSVIVVEAADHARIHQIGRASCRERV